MEELTLYLIDKDQHDRDQQLQISDQQSQIDALKKQVEKLAAMYGNK